MLRGIAFELPTSVPVTGGSGCSSSPGLLGTPRTAQGTLNDLRADAAVGNPRGRLEDQVALLKTPTSQLAVNGGSQHPEKRREGGHGPTLADQVEHELLPTPTSRDGKGANQRGDATCLSGALLPTPSVADGTGGHAARSGPRSGELLLPGVARTLLPTPSAADGNGGGRRGSAGHQTPLPGAVMLLPASTGGSTAELSSGGAGSSGG
jgi:hypothetical protein